MNQIRKQNKLSMLLASMTLLGLMTENAMAAGTASGSTISNQASLSYSVGAVPQTAILSDGDSGTPGVQATTFLVDNKVNMTVTRVDAAPVNVIPGSTPVTAITTFTVTNNGNTSQDFALAATDMAIGTANPFGGALLDSFIASGCTISNVVVATGTMGTYTAGDQFINALTPDSSATVSVTCTIPANQANGTLAVVSLTATAHADNAANTLGAALTNSGANTAAVDVVFADTVAGPAVGDTALNGANSALDAYLIQTAMLTVAKTTAPVCDPANGNANPKNIPGAAVRYAITIANTGGASATLTQVTDTLVAQLAFDPKLNSGALPATNCVSGNVANTLSASGFGAVRGAGTGPTASTIVPAVANATTAGASVTGSAITIDFATLTSTTYGAANATLAAGSYVTVYFNAFVQ